MLPSVDAALAVGYRLLRPGSNLMRPSLDGLLRYNGPSHHNLRRKNVFIATKLYPSGSDNFFVESDDKIKDFLNNLRTDYMDMLLIYFPKTKETELDSPNNAIHRRIPT
ncbi:unnamed protein product [Cylicocyclus nassatus]|uniref:NADP-dependent oxidoreductase domain-containing protein n=1 Tax=Cylicocyclus nassatus TaxID=53992 RepID=A0AA36H9I0_CYLNA|nr:unnamed protein product [Cylicocyclus nassatus]